MKPKTARNPKGAGRKRRQVPRVAITVRMEPYVKVQLEAMRKVNGFSQSRQFSELVSAAYWKGCDK